MLHFNFAPPTCSQHRIVPQEKPLQQYLPNCVSTVPRERDLAVALSPNPHPNECGEEAPIDDIGV